MIVNRSTFVIKNGKMQEAVELLKNGGDYLGKLPTFRIYVSQIGTFNLLVLEQEFESLEKYDQFWTAWAAAPETSTVMKKWNKLTKTGGTSEIWDLK